MCVCVWLFESVDIINGGTKNLNDVLWSCERLKAIGANLELLHRQGTLFQTQVWRGERFTL